MNNFSMQTSFSSERSQLGKMKSNSKIALEYTLLEITQAARNTAYEAPLVILICLHHNRPFGIAGILGLHQCQRMDAHGHRPCVTSIHHTLTKWLKFTNLELVICIVITYLVLGENL